MSEIRTAEAEILTPIGPAVAPAPPWHAGESVASWVARVERDPRQPIVVALNGAPLLRADWGRLAEPGDRVQAILLPTGGGGSSGKILRTLAMLAIAVAAAWAGPEIAVLAGLEGVAGSIVGTVATTAITLIGGLLVNALFPVSQSKPDPQGDVSPTYSLRPTGNLARLGQPIPRVYGRVRLLPDYAAQPFQEYVGDEQYVSQLFCLGLGHYALEQILLDDTVLWRQETLRSLAIAAGTVPPGSGLATDGFIATGSGSISYTTVQDRPSAVATNAAIRTRIAAASVAGGTISARAFVEARTGSATTKLAIVFRDSGLTEVDREEKTLPATTVGESLQIRDVKIPGATAWIDLEIGPTATSNTATVSGVALFEGGLDSSFEDVEVQLVGPGEQLTLFPANVETSSEAGGQELLGTNQDGYDWIGPFAANSPGTLTNRLAVDNTFPTGLFDQDDSGNLQNATVSWEVQARLIDDNGDPISGFFQIGSHTLTRKSRRPLRQTREYPVPFGRYEVKQRRTNASGDITVADTLIWDGLKAYLPDDGTWDDVTLLAVKIRASGQISTTAARRLATIQQALIPVWNGTTWSAPQATRSIAWAFADAARNAVYGGKQPDSRIDLAGLLALDALYTSRGDRFDFVFDTRRTVWDVLKVIGRAGRAQPVQIGHVLTLRRDQAQSLAKAVFTPANIMRGSLKIQYVLQDDEAPDDVEIQYLDEDTWQPETVDCVLPGSTSEQPFSKDLPGVQNRDQAHREGLWEAACNQRRRAFVSWETELQGRLLARGDLILLSHDLPQWGWWGRARTWDVETLTLALDQPVGWVVGPTHYMSLRRPNGQEWGPVIVSRGADDYTVVIDETDHDVVETAQGLSADQVILQDPDWEETHAVVGPGQQYLKRLLLLEAKPRGDRTQLLAVNEDDAVHSAEVGVFPAPRVASLLPGRLAGPPLDGLSVVVAPDSPAEAPVLLCSWRPSADAEYYLGQLSSDGETWTTCYSGPTVGASIAVPPGTIYLRFAAFGTIRGPWSTWVAQTPVGEEVGPLELSIFGNTVNYNIKTAALAAGWNGTDVIDVHLTIYNGCRVGSTSTSTPGLRTGSSWPVGCTITIDNYGLVYGRGGNGGAPNGGDGGDGFWNEGVPTTLNNYGSIAGGGGGGGRGGASSFGEGGGGGGGGQGDNGGSGGAAGSGGGGAQSGGNGSPTGRGAGGAGGGHSEPEVGFIQFAGSGGNGGTLGNGGQGGSAGNGGAAGGSGGASGKAVKGDSNNTWGATGTRLGGIQSAAP